MAGAPVVDTEAEHPSLAAMRAADLGDDHERMHQSHTFDITPAHTGSRAAASRRRQSQGFLDATTLVDTPKAAEVSSLAEFVKMMAEAEQHMRAARPPTPDDSGSETDTSESR